MNIGIALHGGAGTILKEDLTSDLEIKYKNSLKDALLKGREVLQKSGSAVEAVSCAVVELENNPLFNAGKGSVFNHIGKHEMDASIMSGKNLNAGAVCCLDQFKNPILVAKHVMENSEHVILTGNGAIQFAEEMKCEKADETYFFDQFRYDQWLSIKDSDQFQLDHSKTNPKKFGTVGAVALDIQGNLAAATSTGGMTNKKYGRIGDSSVIGAGNYANNNTCAVSCTGSGEFFIRQVTAYDVSCLMEMGQMDLKTATSKVIYDRIKKIGGDGGLISIDNKGNIAMPFNTDGMYRASWSKNGTPLVAIY
ncbi:MAG: isoaspartyl peptidase/L-asparaginase [Bacteroidota bacterium]|nr:isoaspartyl peptidase/L-asparaginase [Bacteroidota bacterium]